MEKKIVKINESQIRSIVRNVLNEVMDELNLYHGTNADFDKFDVAYMSTGWGQQAYGYGFYLTTSYDAAKDYAYDSKSGQVIEVEVPDGKYLSDKSITQREMDRIARIFFKYITEENEDTRDSYPDADTKKAFWDYEADYIRRCSNGMYVYNTIASLMGDYKDTSAFLHDKCGYVGLKIRDYFSNEENPPITYVIFDQNDIKILRKNVLKESYEQLVSPGFEKGLGKFGMFRLSPTLMSCIYEAAFQLLGYERFAIDGEMSFGGIMDNPWDDAYSILKWANENKGLGEKYLGRVSQQYSGMGDEQFRSYIRSVENGKEFWFSRDEMVEIFRHLPDTLRRELVKDMLNVGRSGKVREMVEFLKGLNGGKNLEEFIEIMKNEYRNGNVKKGGIGNLREPVRRAMETCRMLGK